MKCTLQAKHGLAGSGAIRTADRHDDLMDDGYSFMIMGLKLALHGPSGNVHYVRSGITTPMVKYHSYTNLGLLNNDLALIKIKPIEYENLQNGNTVSLNTQDFMLIFYYFISISYIQNGECENSENSGAKSLLS